MRTRRLVLFLALTALICGLFSAVPVTAGKQTISLDGHVRELSKSIPSQLNYQGFLLDSSDSSTVTAVLEMTFCLFDLETDGTELWAETHPAVEVSDGLFQVLLGSVTSFPDDLFDGSEIWLQTEVETEVLSPRKPLVSVAYSHRTNSAEMLLDNTLADLDDRWVNEADLDHLDAADGDPAEAVYVDDDGKVGIGTTSPLTELDVAGSVNAATYYGDGSNLTGISGTIDNDWTIDGDDVYHQTGNVGIGTASPDSKLDVQAGSVNLYGSGAKIQADIDTNPSFYNGTLYLETPVADGKTSLVFGADGSKKALIQATSEGGHAGALHLYTRNTGGPEERMTISKTGAVGIGTQSPVAKLHVLGDTDNVGHMGSSDYGVYGKHGASGNFGRLGSSSFGIYGHHSSSGNYGFVGGSDYGVCGVCFDSIGVYGYSIHGSGVAGESFSGHAGYFYGDVHITGTLTGGKTVIDHPLDPENKLLRHNLVESPQNMLIYAGKVALDGSGEAVVEMPEYFEALTKEEEALIHLTPLGRPFPVGYEWNPSKSNFIVYGEPDREVSWMALADRDDPVMRQLARPVEEEKGPENKLCDRGELLYPTAYGYPETRGKDYKEQERMRRNEPQEVDRYEN